MEHTRFPPGDEPRVLTSVSDECSDGHCADCPEVFEREETGEEPIFCVHDYHKKRNLFECPTCGGVTNDPKAGSFQHLIAGRVHMPALPTGVRRQRFGGLIVNQLCMLP